MSSSLKNIGDQNPPEYAYHVLRGAIEKYSKGVINLSNKELAVVCRQADKTFEIESKVISSKEASEIVIQQPQVENAVKELRSRYPDHDTFIEDLSSNGMTEEVLYRALHRELLFDAVMNRVGSRGAEISDIDVQLFYQLHVDRFDLPEIRIARHLLITINPEYPENTRKNAKKRIDQISSVLAADPGKFNDFVLKNSECPTGLQGGLLGKVKRGDLYPELDEALFNMKEDELSEVIETEAGFHILLCEKIEKPKNVSLSDARYKIKQILEERRRRNCQKAWLAEL